MSLNWGGRIMALHSLNTLGMRAVPVRTSWHCTCSKLPQSTTLGRRSLTSESLREQKKRRVSAMYYVPSPSTTDPLSVIPKLPQLDLDDRPILRKALIVATPGLAPWFEEGHPFLENAMKWMYSPILSESPPITHVAIVDSLPDPRSFQDWFRYPDRPFPRAEGLGICLLSDVVSSQQVNDNNDRPAILRVLSQKSELSREYKSLPRGVFSSLTIPLANTIFVNGQRSTAFRLKWRPTEDGQSLTPEGDRIPVDRIQFNIFRDPLRTFSHFVPLLALTEPRVVVSSMGNVIRQLQGDGDEIIGASKELESAVPKFLARGHKDGEDVSIQVFARVMPADDKHIFVEQKTSPNTVDATTEQPKESGYTLTYHALWRGGSLYRVTSGGGGWGKKAGLLSLDPATNFEPLISTEQSMFPEFDAGDTGVERSRDIRTLIPAGHTIQFFAAKIPTPKEPYYTESPDDPTQSSSTSTFPPEKWSQMKSEMTQLIVLGNTMSSDDPMSTMPTEEERLAPVQSIPGCFGALSEGGTSVAVLKRTARDPDKQNRRGADFDWQTLNEFRIDVPYATFKALVTKRPKKNSSGANAENSGSPSISSNATKGTGNEFPPLRTRKPSEPVIINKYTASSGIVWKIGARKRSTVRKHPVA